MSKFKVGDKVVMACKEPHEIYPCYFPAVGIVGIVKSTNHISSLIQWPKGSTSDKDEWYVDNNKVKLLEGEKNMFTKDMLRTGHIVTTRDKRKMLVMRNYLDDRDWFIDKKGCVMYSFDNYTDTLKSVHVSADDSKSDIDIMKVEYTDICRETLNFLQNNIKLTTVWERKEDLNLTVAICNHNGNNADFWFEAPKDCNIKKGSEVLVDTRYGEHKARVKEVVFFKTQQDLNDYVKRNDVCGPTFPLKKVVGVINRV